MSELEYHRPGSLDELWPLMERQPEARLVAGATDVMVRVASRVERPGAMISLRGIADLARLELGPDGARVGATVTIARLASDARLGASYPLLVQAARALGGPQIRSVATIGGNLCNASPCADTAPPLLALEARAALRGPAGQREVPLEQLFAGPGQTCLGAGEILEAVLLPPPLADARGQFLKKRRVRMDLALVSVAALLRMEGSTCRLARVAAGSVAPTPLRLGPVEAVLEGSQLTDAVLEQAATTAASCVDPIDDLRATEAYRRQLTGVFVKRAAAAALGGAS